MKTKSVYVAIIMALMSTGALSAQLKTEKFKVFGNCSMCETRIEKAAKSVEGVSFADWNKETKMMDVSFDSVKTDVHKVHMAIANAGHDTEMHRANDDVYNALPACCRYDRADIPMHAPGRSGF
ncbi:MAG: heavy-metal-associated domain-containing protein [Bacteroidales bacterium]|nr:heavy-metal-associated domain-containing protein [Bacteroidales bacterium]